MKNEKHFYVSILYKKSDETPEMSDRSRN